MRELRMVCTGMSILQRQGLRVTAWPGWPSRALLALQRVTQVQAATKRVVAPTAVCVIGPGERSAILVQEDALQGRGHC